jgi:hypothetical protein
MGRLRGLRLLREGFADLRCNVAHLMGERCRATLAR